MNTPIVQKQITKYTFIQGTISTIGERFNELRLPIHKDSEEIRHISDNVKNIIDTKRTLREQIEDLIKQ